MKVVMQRRFIPSCYHRELYQKPKNLTQGTTSVEDYYKEMEVAMIRVDVQEDREATMARFLAGLNRDIDNVVDNSRRKESYEVTPLRVHPNGTKTQVRVSTNQSKEPVVPIKSNKFVAQSSKGKAPENVQSRSRDIKCFKCQGRGHIESQCLNSNTMIILPNGEIESEDEVDKNEDEVEHPSENEDEVEFAVEGEMLVVKRSLNAQNSVSEPQRKNLFYTRSHVLGKVYNIVINGESCTNVASTLMIEKLSLPTLKHPSPYKLQRLNERVELKVTKQVLIPFSIGNYHDEVL
ncbi:hypothetical protein EPI10_020967 [Gossypium australe]|uniref:Retrotransposon gag domain-containing protein n=1 Tax=Gossypium australe TaxID=47621 RepID=A0A5B6WGS5_9ROSI|nr:hypothetical protein EPI10_020967 [Gossypium australe]